MQTSFLHHLLFVFGTPPIGLLFVLDVVRYAIVQMKNAGRAR